jgi:hypothetical protein
MAGRLLVSTRKGLFCLGPSGRGRWQVERVCFLGDNVTLTLPDPRDGLWYAALDHGHFGAKLHRSPDRGATWEEVGVPAYPEPPAGYEEKDPMGRVIPWQLQRFWALEPGLADQEGLLWAGTIPGGLFRSPDRGATWDLVRSLWEHPDRRRWLAGGADYPGIHSICVDPRDGRRVTLAVSSGGVWRSEDGGGTWACHGQGMRAAYVPPGRETDMRIQDVHRLVQCPTHPETLWAQHHNGIYHSADGGAVWRLLVPSDAFEPRDSLTGFGFPVAVHPQDPDTAWFVPGDKDERRVPLDAKVVVLRTRDGGRSFETLRRGLPQEQAYDLVLRHALDADADGRGLAFGSTTGSLWVSEDGGDAWTTVAEHLPPVYAVRWA